MELSGDNVPNGFDNKNDIIIYGVLGIIGLITASFFIDDYRFIIGGGSIFYLALLIGYWLSD